MNSKFARFRALKSHTMNGRTGTSADTHRTIQRLRSNRKTTPTSGNSQNIDCFEETATPNRIAASVFRSATNAATPALISITWSGSSHESSTTIKSSGVCQKKSAGASSSKAGRARPEREAARRVRKRSARPATNIVPRST